MVHIPDLPLIGNRYKVGFGLWNHPAISFSLEAAFLSGGLWLYFRTSRLEKPGGSVGFIGFGSCCSAFRQ